MFIAKRENGTEISLIHTKWSKIDLMIDRNTNLYFCPLCKEEVILKLGSIQTWHFAHKPSSSCEYSRGGETEAHIKAKILLNRWLTDHGYSSSIECYLPEIKQRADVLATIENKRYAFEIQHSFIDEKQFVKRHKCYLSLGIEPFWIGLHTTSKEKKDTLTSSTSLHNLLIRNYPILHSVYINIDEPSWSVLTNYLYISSQKIMVQRFKASFFISPKQFLELNNFQLEISTHDYFYSYYSIWITETKKKRVKVYLSMNKLERYMLTIFQNYQVNLNYFPALANIPLKSNFYIQSPPQWWQSWIVITIINETPLQKSIAITSICEKIRLMIDRRIFCLRRLPVPDRELIRFTILEYFDVLSYFGVLEKMYSGVYKVKSHIKLKKQLDTLSNDDQYVICKLKELGWRNSHKKIF
ncbi:competence protein CoiA [Evansella sp. AB-rgal1]|uniref:competence protein CoiA n=1 Tax=Evansella sp. AB-rgal1 TaxID=3242696 RepID=UPI00359D5A1A